MKTNKELRMIGRENLRGNYLTAVSNLILVGVFGLILQSILGKVLGISTIDITADITANDLSDPYGVKQFIVTLITSFVSALLTLGLTWGFLDIQDGEKLTVGHLFKPFKEGMGKSIAFSLFKQFLLVLWSLLLIVPGIIKSYSWAMAEFIYYDNRDLAIKDILAESSYIMKGSRWRLFKMDFFYSILYFVPILLWLVFFLVTLASQGDNASYVAAFALLGILVVVIVLTTVLAFIIEPRRLSARAAFYVDLVGKSNDIV